MALKGPQRSGHSPHLFTQLRSGRLTPQPGPSHSPAERPLLRRSPGIGGSHMWGFDASCDRLEPSRSADFASLRQKRPAAAFLGPGCVFGAPGHNDCKTLAAKALRTWQPGNMPHEKNGTTFAACCMRSRSGVQLRAAVAEATAQLALKLGGARGRDIGMVQNRFRTCERSAWWEMNNAGTSPGKLVSEPIRFGFIDLPGRGRPADCPDTTRPTDSECSTV